MRWSHSRVGCQTAMIGPFAPLAAAESALSESVDAEPSIASLQWNRVASA